MHELDLPVLAGIGLAGTLLLLVVLLRLGTMVWRSRLWPSVPGTVEECRMHERLEFLPGGRWVVKMKYRYRVGEEDFHGTRLKLLGSQALSEKAAREQQALYPPGREVPVFYHPAKPWRATLVTGMHTTAYWVLGMVPLILVLLGLYVRLFLGVLHEAP